MNDQSFASDQEFRRNGRRIWLLDRTRHRSRCWMTVTGESTGFDAGTRTHSTREAAMALIEGYLA